MTIPIRIWRMSGMDCYGDDITSGLEGATGVALAAIRQAGFTGIWVTARLRDVTRTEIYPTLGHEALQYQRRICELVERCAEHQLKVYFYLNEPRGFAADDPFWESHPQVRGAAGSCVMEHWDRSSALCTSAPETLAFLEQGCTDLFTAVPGLGGVVCITASESHTHCYSHFETRDSGLGEHHGQVSNDVLSCERCRDREPRQIIAETIGAIERGVHGVSPGADVIAWTWSWDMYDPPPQRELIALLPPTVILMSDFERGGELVYEGCRLPVDEYSLNYIGPSDRCRDQLTIARERGLRVMARMQINHTIEMATAPNLPLISNLVKKLFALTKLSADDVMATWSFGCTIDTINVFAVEQFFKHKPSPSQEAVFLRQLAEDYFSLCDGQQTANAWQAFGQTMQAYPFTMGFLYFGPFNCSLVYPLANHEPLTRSMKIWNFDSNGLGDRLEETLDPLTLEQLIHRLDTLRINWAKALTLYQKSLAGATETDRMRKELNVAQYVGHLIHSTWVIYSWFAWRYDRGAVADLDEKTIKRRLAMELDNLDQAYTLIASDDRLGFYEESQAYFVTPEKISVKRTDIAQLLEQLENKQTHQQA